MGLVVVELGREICWFGMGGTSSGEASNRATRSLNEAFLDLEAVGITVEGFVGVLSQAPFGMFWVFNDSLRELIDVLTGFAEISPFECAETNIASCVADLSSSSRTKVVARMASWCRAIGDELVNWSWYCL